MATTRGKKAQHQPEDSWFSDPQDLPRADIDLRDKQARRQKTYRVLIFTVLFGLFPLSLLSNMAMMPKLLDSGPVAEVKANDLNPATKSAAILEVNRWLAQNPSPLPGGVMLSWDGAEIQAEPSISVDPNNNQAVEKQGLQLHHMTVSTPTGAVFSTTVQVGYSKVRGAKVLGAPTLIPKAMDDPATWPNLESWPNLVTVPASDAVSQAASAWVDAFTSGDPNKLRLAVGDQNAAHSYVPLVQAKASDVRVDKVGAREDPEASGSEKKPSQIVARVTFAIQWAGQDVGNRGNALGRVSYDLLIEKADTGAPVIVAWGGVGTGESLVPYMNAVERKLTADAIAEAVPTTAPAQPAATTPVPAPAPTSDPTSIPTVGAVVPPNPKPSGK